MTEPGGMTSEGGRTPGGVGVPPVDAAAAAAAAAASSACSPSRDWSIWSPVSICDEGAVNASTVENPMATPEICVHLKIVLLFHENTQK